MRFEGVQSGDLGHGDLRRLNGDGVREGGPLVGERDLWARAALDEVADVS